MRNPLRIRVNQTFTREQLEAMIISYAKVSRQNSSAFEDYIDRFLALQTSGTFDSMKLGMVYIFPNRGICFLERVRGRTSYIPIS